MYRPARILDLVTMPDRPGQPRSVGFTVSPDARGIDVVETLRRVTFDNYEVQTYITELLTAGISTGGFLDDTELSIEAEKADGMPEQETVSQMLSFGDEPTIDDVRFALELMYGNTAPHQIEALFKRFVDEGGLVGRTILVNQPYEIAPTTNTRASEALAELIVRSMGPNEQC
jgi:hypothetical protein